MTKNIPFTNRQLIVCIFFLTLLTILGLTAVVHAKKVMPATTVAHTPIPRKGPAPTLSIGGFDSTRASISSISQGSAFEDARASIATNYPQATYTTFTTLTQPALTNVDILILPATYNFSIPIVPLTTAEQTILHDYVLGGGCAILMPDNQDFNPANESLLDPFGMDISGMIWGWLTVTIPNPVATPLTNGTHGTVSSFTQAWPGGLTNLGPYGQSYATNAIGHAIAIIEKDAIAQGSGAVIVYSDVATFVDASDGGGFADNEMLFLNSIAFCQHQKIYLPLLLKE